MSLNARTHQIFFSIAPADRSLIAKWLLDVREFFGSTGAPAADLSKLFVSSQGITRTTLSGVVSSNFGNIDEQINNTSKDEFTMDEVLEGITVHNAVHLISILGHYSQDIRIGSVFLLFDLAVIFDKKVDELRKKLGKISLGFQGDDRGKLTVQYNIRCLNNDFLISGIHAAVHEFFHYIGPAFSNMAVALAAGLECFLTINDWNVRGVCISALTRLVYENEKVFLEEDHLAAIWNLHFSMGLIPMISKIFPDRIVIIRVSLPLTSFYLFNKSLNIGTWTSCTPLLLS
jgi:hypothetical protein